MEKPADTIQALLKEKLACYRQLNLILKAEKKAISAIDLGMIWDTTKAKKDLANKIEKLRHDIVLACQDQFPGMEIKTTPFSLSAVVHDLPAPNKSKNDIRAIKRSIDKEKDIADHFIKSNRTQVKKHLSVVDNIMALMGNNAAQDRYTGNAMVDKRKQNNCLFMAQV